MLAKKANGDYKYEGSTNVTYYQKTNKDSIINTFTRKDSESSNKGTDISGSNISNFRNIKDLSSISSDDQAIELCKKICNHDSKCKSFTYDSGASNGKCWFKNIKTESKIKDNVHQNKTLFIKNDN